MSRSEDHYKVLGLRKDCSAQEIRDAFIALSKKYHPDLNKESSNKNKFQKVNQAYSVLGKPYTRSLYDRDLLTNSRNSTDYTYQYEVHRRKYDNTFWEERVKYEGPFKERPYYSIKGLKKVSNTMVVLLCLVVALAGAGVEFMTATNSFTFNRERLKHDSARNNIFLEQARKRASTNGIEEQIRKFECGELYGESIQEANEEYVKRLLSNKK